MIRTYNPNTRRYEAQSTTRTESNVNTPTSNERTQVDIRDLVTRLMIVESKLELVSKAKTIKEIRSIMA